jgi:hypothetical protein
MHNFTLDRRQRDWRHRYGEPNGKSVLTPLAQAGIAGWTIRKK